MPDPNIIVSSLPAYVQNNRDVLLKNFGLVGTETRRRISLQTGIKKSAYLNYLEVSPTLQDGLGCGFSAAGTATLTQRTINVAAIKVNMTICPDTLIGKWAEYLVRINANEQDLPFEQWIIDGIVAEINKKIEKLIWQGDVSQTTNPDLKWIDGFLEQFGDDADVIDVDIAAGSSVYDGLLAVYAAMPEEVLERDAAIHISPALYRIFLQEMVALNYYHYAGPQNAAPEEFILPGTTVPVVKTPGLAGSLQIVGTFDKNLVYGTDMENDWEDFKVTYDEKDEVFLIKVKWATGVSCYFPGFVVLGEYAAQPGLPVGNAAHLAAIAESVDDIATAAGTIATNTGNIKDNSTAIDNIATAAGKLAGTVNADNQIETHPNTQA